MLKMASSLKHVPSVFAFICSFIVICNSEHDEMLPKVGIIGAGISGTSTAYFLRELFGDRLKIDIFEAEKVGGRASLINIDGHNYEAGASIIHPKNKYMLQFVDKFFKDKPKIVHRGGRIGLYNSDGLVFETSDWAAITFGKLLARYGFDFYNIKTWLDNLYNNHFQKIYQFQDKGMAFTTVEELLRTMGDYMVNTTKHSMHDILQDAGLSQAFINEFGTAAMRTNYGQTTNAHGFVGIVTMFGVQPDLWSVNGGNCQIPIQLLQASKANLIKAKVTSIAFIKGDHGGVSYEVDYTILDGDQKGRTRTKEYDIVILAAPILDSESKISFVDFSDSVTNFHQDYHRTVAMFVQGNVNKTTFGIQTEDNLPSTVLTTDPEVYFNSISKQSPVEPVQSKDDFNSKPPVWKTFLNQVPTEEQVGKLFENKKDFRLVDWLAYPEYKPDMHLPPFVLSEGMYYVNAIESAAATLETSVIGAKNVALLAYNHFHGNLDKIDELHSAESEGIKERSDL